MTDWTSPALAGVALAAAAALVVVALVVLLVRSRKETARALARAADQQAALVSRLEALERTRAGAPAVASEFVITDVGSATAPVHGAEPPVAGRIEGRLFADLVLRETVVKAAAWGHGLRRALSPEVRNRARFEMRRETRRAARQRKVDVKEALRQYHARERGDVA